MEANKNNNAANIRVVVAGGLYEVWVNESLYGAGYALQNTGADIARLSGFDPKKVQIKEAR